MLRIIYRNGAYAEYVKDDQDMIFAQWYGACSGDALQADELYDDITNALNDGARIEYVVDA